MTGRAGSQPQGDAAAARPGAEGRALLDTARAWIAEIHPHAHHLDRAESWLVALEPEASDAMRIAAVTHDIERAFPDPDVRWDSAEHWDDPEYNRWHQDRCAAIIADWLAEQGAPEELSRDVEALVRAHEDGGWPEADLVQAADSLSFLETMVPLIVAWVETGKAPPERAEGKLRHSASRISSDLPRAREIAAAMLTPALSRVRAANAPDTVRRLAGIVRTGRIFRLARDRFPKMPLFPGHPSFEVVSYRSPQGIRAAGEEPWGPPNKAGLGYMSELVIGTTHTGAHIDAHAHMTVGDEDRWHGGSARTDLGDFGPLKGDATEIPPLWRRGVLYDVPGFRGVGSLGAGEAVSASELEAIEREHGVAAGQGDVALVRTGYLAHWPDREALEAHRGGGPDLSAARLLADRGVIATGSDTETYEVQPAPDRGTPANPQPVHTLLLIERGIYILESLDLEELARAGAREFLFVALPLAIRGATGSMVDPIAVA
ncbi:MAG TPA: cyclase family protein [Solirubrobacterales bacterium]|nr:cyclase family protein [Solirubrobacterales bacterium]